MVGAKRGGAAVAHVGISVRFHADAASTPGRLQVAKDVGRVRRGEL
jgi:hypothetical protein